jgi:transposase
VKSDLLAHGLIRSSFVPPVAIQELRDLTRTRKQLMREVSQHCLRIQKVLEDANLKVGSVLSNVLGRSGRAILQARSTDKRTRKNSPTLPRERHAKSAPSWCRPCMGASALTIAGC